MIDAVSRETVGRIGLEFAANRNAPLLHSAMGMTLPRTGLRFPTCNVVQVIPQ